MVKKSSQEPSSRETLQTRQNVRNMQSLRSPTRSSNRDHALIELWRQFKVQPKSQQSQSEAREQLILEHLHLVRYVVNRLPMTLPPNVTQEDLMSYGVMGLIESIERFDVSRGLKFETYAITRIRGSIIDQLRVQDWIPRGVRKRTKTLQETMARLETELGRPATDDELAEALGVSRGKIIQMLSESSNYMLSLDDTVGNDTSGSPLLLLETIQDENAMAPEDSVAESESQQLLAAAVDSLPEREKLLVALYYHEEMTLKEIGDILSVSESRVCQLHAQALLRLRKKLVH